MQQRIISFTDLNAWREGHKLVLMVYGTTDGFPTKEQFCLVNQLNRAVVSITSNIAEGFTKNSGKEKVKFFNTALSSLTEVQNQILIARDRAYITNTTFKCIADQTVVVSKLLSGLLRTARGFNHKNVLIQDTKY